MTALDEYLRTAGFSDRRPQTLLFEHLIFADNGGVIAQAGTGTGKSAGILSAAAETARRGGQSIIVTPTLTLMNQYRDGDMRVARKAFPDLVITEVRGMSHYACHQSRTVMGVMDIEHGLGCLGFDGGCTQKGWEGHTDRCDSPCDQSHPKRWECGYRRARYESKMADIVVTNADMLIVNDRNLLALGQEFLHIDDATLFVDEAHTLEQKLRDYASRSLFFKTIERFSYAESAAKRLAAWVKNQDKQSAIKDSFGFPETALREIANVEMPVPRPQDGLSKQRETQEACKRIVSYLGDPHESAVLHVGQGSLKMDWINIGPSCRELLSARPFGLVSATVPRTMGSTLGVPEASFIDVGHPFNYAEQAWIGFSSYAGDYRSAQSATNFETRVSEVMELIRRANGGALVLFSSFRDLEAVTDRLAPQIKGLGLNVLAQEREMEASDRQALASEFKADGNAVLFGSESFATGFDVPGDALRLLVMWKLPFPAMDPVSNAIRSQSYARYDDMMKVRAVQAIGRLIRRESDKGIVWVADNRGRRLLDPRDPLTTHLPQFARLS